MDIIAALYIDDIEVREVPGPSTRLDLSGVQFSAPAPAPVPVTIAPHLVVLVWNPPGGRDTGALEVVFTRDEAAEGDDPLARNVQLMQIEPGRFNYRLVRAELAFEDYGTVLARCRIDEGPERVVPYTLLPPLE